MPIDHQQPALTEAREWLQRHGVDEPPDVASQAAHRPSEHPGDVDADVESVARTIALRKLTIRACTRYELDQALQAKNVPRAAIDVVLDRLEEVGLVDDASFAVDWVTSRQQRRHLSRHVLRRELQAKGVQRSDIDSALGCVDFDAELKSARELVERKRAAMNGLSRDVQYRRLAGILSRRGFDAAISTRVLTDVLAE